MNTRLSFTVTAAATILLSCASALAEAPFHTETLKGLETSLTTATGEPPVADRLTKKKYLFIYFSAHWCPPCRKFTPKLVEFYKTNSKNGDYDLLFISSDKDQAAMDEYMKSTSMPWVGVKLGNDKAKELKKKYGVRGIPCLVLIDENDQLLASSYDGDNYLGADVALTKYLSLKK